MQSEASQPHSGQWLLDVGLKQLELLFRAIVYQLAEPISSRTMTALFGTSVAVRAGCSGFQRNKIIGRRLDDFAEPGFRPQIEHLWRTFLQRGEQRGTFRLLGSDGGVREVEYTAKGNALPERHVLALRDKSPGDKSVTVPGAVGTGEDPAWMQDYALFLFDAEGRVVGWYSGAERIYGYQSQEIVGQPVSCLFPDEDALGVNLREELKRAAAQGHFGSEGWHIRTGRDFGRTCLRWRSETKAGNCGALGEWCATLESATWRKRGCGAAECSGS
jgi:formate hydrogenlyase transcriptional activator